MIALRQLEAQTADYGLPAGNAKLRHAIARHLGASRAVSCESHDVIITNGAQQAFTIIARALCDPGATVAIEDPGYRPRRQSGRANRADPCAPRPQTRTMDRLRLQRGGPAADAVASTAYGR
jgi:DNA-binding transcriptional MocR family regulator